MTCVHLQKLYELKISTSDLVHIVCKECGVKEVCPSVLFDEYDAEEAKA